MKKTLLLLLTVLGGYIALATQGPDPAGAIPGDDDKKKTEQADTTKKPELVATLSLKSVVKGGTLIFDPTKNPVYSDDYLKKKKEYQSTILIDSVSVKLADKKFSIITYVSNNPTWTSDLTLEDILSKSDTWLEVYDGTSSYLVRLRDVLRISPERLDAKTCIEPFEALLTISAPNTSLFKCSKNGQ